MTRTFPASTTALDDVIAFFDETLESIGCSMKQITQIDLCIEEMFVNVALYAYDGAAGEVFISIEKAEDSVVISLTDNGIPFNPLLKEEPDITLSAEDRQIGGLGIFMVKRMMDDIQYERKDGSNILKMYKKIG